MNPFQKYIKFTYKSPTKIGFIGLAYEYYGMNPDGSFLSSENAGVVDPEAQITEESKHPAEYNTFHKEYRGRYSNRYYDGGSYDDYGFYYLPDGSFYDPNGYYFDQNGKDEYGGYYNEHGEYVESQQDKPQKPKEQSKPKQSEESKEPEELKVPEEPKELHDSHEFDDGEDEEEEKYTKDYIEYVLENKYFENFDHLKSSKNECFYLKIGNLPENTTKYDLLHYFNGLNINNKHVTIVMEYVKSSLIARLEIYNKSTALQVLQICGSDFEGKQMVIEVDEENEKYYCGEEDEYYHEHDEYDEYDEDLHEYKSNSKKIENKEHSTNIEQSNQNSNKHA